MHTEGGGGYRVIIANPGIKKSVFNQQIEYTHPQWEIASGIFTNWFMKKIKISY